MKKPSLKFLKRFSLRQFIIGFFFFALIKLAVDYFVFPEKRYEFSQTPYWVGFAITSLLFALIFSLWVTPKEK